MRKLSYPRCMPCFGLSQPTPLFAATALAIIFFAGASSASAQTTKQAARAYIDLATYSSDMPGMGMFTGAGGGGQPAGGLGGALGGMFGGAVGGATGSGNTFGTTHAGGFGAAGKFMDVSVHAPKNPSLDEAAQAIPGGMKLGASLKLVSPASGKPIQHDDDQPIEPQYEKPKGKISIYWGCGETVRPGQPRTLDMAKVSMDEYAKFFVARSSTTRGARSQPGHPSWPNKPDDRRVPDSASLVGEHAFSGSGIPENFKVTLGAAQDLMPPIELNQKKSGDGGVMLEWKTIPHARGYFISVMGGKSGRGSEEMIFWTSSELPDTGFGLVNYQTNSSIDKWLKEKVILPPSTTKCAVPKGIFGDKDGGMLNMIAYGHEAFFAFPPRPADAKKPWDPVWQAKVRVKSTLASMLGGMEQRGSRQEDGGRDYTSQPRDSAKKRGGDTVPGVEDAVKDVLKNIFKF